MSFIELTTRATVRSPWKRTLLRASSIILVVESSSEGGAVKDSNSEKSTLTLSSGEGVFCAQTADEVLGRILKLEGCGNNAYSIDLDGSGFSTTAMVTKS